MYGDFVGAKVLAWLVLLYGSGWVLVDLIGYTAFSFPGAILILIGIAFLRTFKTTSEEFDTLRRELREIRALADEKHKNRSEING